MAISLLLHSQSELLAQLPQQWLVLLLVILLPAISYLLLTRRGGEKGLKLPPGPPQPPVLGNLHQLGPLPHQSLRDLARRHGPVMFLRLGMTSALAVSSAAAARDVMRTHDADCCNRPELPGNKQLTYGFKSVAFSPYGAYWRDMRRLFATELLGARRLREVWDARREQVEKLVRTLSRAAAGSAPVAMDEHVYGVADGIIGTMAFGSVYAAATFAGRYERFQHVLDEAMDVTAGFSAEDFPNAAGRLCDRLTGVVARRERIVKDLDAFFEAVIEQRTDPRPEDDENGGLVDALVVMKKARDSVLIVGVYVDDLIITGGNNQAIEDFKRQMKSKFSMTDLGLLSYYLGIEVKQGEEGITLCQSGYASRILEKMGMLNCNPTHTPMEPRLKLSKKSQAEEVDSTEYRSVVGSLRYLLHTRPDLSFSVGYVSRFMKKPTREHMMAVKHILRYVKGTINLGCSYRRVTSKPELLGYCDSDYAGDVDDRKSTTGFLYYFGHCPITWTSQKQRIVAQSSCEAEYVAAASAACQGIWLGRLIGELLGREANRFALKIDNQSAISLCKNPVFHERSKHIDTRYHYVRDCVDKGKIAVEHVRTENQLADILTKPLSRLKFLEMKEKLGLQNGAQGFTKDNVKAILLDALLGGVDTSSVTIIWAMSELVRKPQVMRKAQEEIRASVAEVGGDYDNGEFLLVQPEDLPKLRYLKMVVKETLRLHPPATLLLPRETAGHVELGGYDVPAGTRLLVNAWAIGRDPASWGEDAEEFAPERFEAGDVDFRGAHFELLPFGAGRRICPGLAMGVANVEFTLANMLCVFDWALPEGMEEVSLEEAGGLIIHRKKPLVLVPTVHRPTCGQ
ncbi:unnamed protein product [Alopecurus aequalis]